MAAIGDPTEHEIIVPIPDAVPDTIPFEWEKELESPWAPKEPVPA